METSDAGTYQTKFSNLSVYANQINTILGIAVPEPVAFGLFAGTLAAVRAGTLAGGELSLRF